MLARAHERIRHARHRHVREGLATTIAGWLYAHETRIQLVLQIADEHAVLNEGRTLGRRGFVIDIQRATATRQRAVIDDRAFLARHALTDAIGECGRALAIEVAFEAVPDRLMEQHTGPTWAEHHGHRPRR